MAESKPYADDFEFGWATGLHFGANNPEQAKKYIATSEYWSKRDVKLVVHGEWISRYSDGYKVGWDEQNPECPAESCYCSVCGDWLTASDEYPVKGNFCPNCGADMRGNNDG